MARKRIEDTPETLKRAILTMQEKILDHEDEFREAPLDIEAEMRDGRIIRRANHAAQEYRALVRDFAAAMKAYRDLTSDGQAEEVDALGDIRSRFRVAK